MSRERERSTPTLDSYLADFDLREEDLIGKLVLDAGAGRRMLAKEAAELGITGIVSLGESRHWWADVLIMMKQLRQVSGNSRGLKLWEEVGAKTIEGRLEYLPIREGLFDLILCRDTLVPQIFADGTMMRLAFEEMVRVTKSGGRILVLPIWLENWEEGEKKMVEGVLLRLASRGDVVVSYQLVERTVAGMKLVGLRAEMKKL